MTQAHDQKVTNTYIISFLEHEPRQDDPHYHAFNAYKKAHKHEAVCYVGKRIGYEYCGDEHGNPIPNQPDDGIGLELHHTHLEFAVINGVDLKALEVDFPNLTDPEKVAEWAETDANFMFLCAKHHRSGIGAHHASFADFSGSMYVPGMLKENK
jgi:hypothetical protein